MSNIKVILLLTFSGIVKRSQPSPELQGLFLPTNNQILATIDAVFATLKINHNFTKSKNIAHYLSLHNFVKDTVEKNDKIYQIICKTCKSESSNKTGAYISSIEKVIGEMIMIHKLQISKYLINNNRSNYRNTIQNRLVTDFIQFAKGFHLKLNTPSPNDLLGVIQQEKWSEREGRAADGRRIFNGTATSVARYPFMASLHVRGRFVCPGSLVRADLVITAASGLIPFISPQSDPKSVKARVGSDYTNKLGELVPVAGFHFHPKFNWTTLRCNLAIIRLKNKLKLEDGKLTAIQYDTTAQQLTADVKKIIILGWGEKRASTDLGYRYDGSNKKLSLARLDLQDLKECKYKYSRTYVSNKHFCASSDSNGGGACQFDVGGPAVAGRTLVGVASFGASRCGERDAPTVFTKLGFYADWIESVINEVPPCNQQNHQKPQSVIIPDPDDIAADEKWFYLKLLKTGLKSATEKDLRDLLNELEEEDEIYNEKRKPTMLLESTKKLKHSKKRRHKTTKPNPSTDFSGGHAIFDHTGFPTATDMSNYDFTTKTTIKTTKPDASTYLFFDDVFFPTNPSYSEYVIQDDFLRTKNLSIGSKKLTNKTGIPQYSKSSVFSGTTTTGSVNREYSEGTTPGMPLKRMGQSFYYEHYLRKKFPIVKKDQRRKEEKTAPTMWAVGSIPRFNDLDKKNLLKVLDWQSSKRSLQVPSKIHCT